MGDMLLHWSSVSSLLRGKLNDYSESIRLLDSNIPGLIDQFESGSLELNQITKVVRLLKAKSRIVHCEPMIYEIAMSSYFSQETHRCKLEDLILANAALYFDIPVLASDKDFLKLAIDVGIETIKS